MESKDKPPAQPTKDEVEGGGGSHVENDGKDISQEHNIQASSPESIETMSRQTSTVAEHADPFSIDAQGRAEDFEGDAAEAKHGVDSEMPEAVPEATSESEFGPRSQRQNIEEVEEDTNEENVGSVNSSQGDELTTADDSNHEGKEKANNRDWDEIVANTNPDYFDQGGDTIVVSQPWGGPNDKESASTNNTDPDGDLPPLISKEGQSDSDFEADMERAKQASLLLNYPTHHGNNNTTSEPSFIQSLQKASSHDSDTEYPDTQEGILRSLQEERANNSSTGRSVFTDDVPKLGEDEEDESDSELSESDDGDPGYPLYGEEDIII
ncbi:hypothetical protein BKA64DRAFT_638268 [Cadophora sp. MPI-SDFR-AT-0126]|nr:hypothetical protein BKA64DRAFT_638268 [Leotiomycetes sp. MPI-SDFR-AT-0126]